MGKLAELCGRIERLLRLRASPVAVAVLERGVEGARRADSLGVRALRLCQMLTLSAIHGWIVEADGDTMAYMCSYIMGLRDELPDELAREYACYWHSRVDDGLLKIKDLYRVSGGGRIVVSSPIGRAPYEPDVIVFRLNPAQACIALSAMQWSRYRRFTFTYTGESACSDSIARCMVTGEPSLTIPCFGERRFGHLQDDELIVALKPEHLAEMVEGLEALWRRGVRYPIPLYGPQADTIKGLPERYRRLYDAQL